MKKITMQVIQITVGIMLHLFHRRKPGSLGQDSLLSIVLVRGPFQGSGRKPTPYTVSTADLLPKWQIPKGET